MTKLEEFSSVILSVVILFYSVNVVCVFQCWFSALIPECLWMWGATRLNNALRRQATQRIRHRSGTKIPSSLSTGSLSTGSLSDIDNEDGKFKTS